ncbi:MAG: DUF3311 domain-containing protein [Streptosporangiales bacterium]|nr:DUF3311 domain-containing protein [Streptosporangiales bacterium]MBO0891876.1 DUF3311 domain-containing protein [Acidothermales bacterium]
MTPRRIAALVLVVIGIVVPLLVTTYTRDEPRLFGFPFFYWYQLLLVFVTAALTASAYLLTTRDDRARRRRAAERNDRSER